MMCLLFMVVKILAMQDSFSKTILLIIVSLILKYHLSNNILSIVSFMVSESQSQVKKHLFKSNINETIVLLAFLTQHCTSCSCALFLA